MSNSTPPPIAEPRDVRERVNLSKSNPDEGDNSGISDDEIRTHLEDATFELSQATRVGRMNDSLRKQLEWRIAAIQILSIRKGSRSYHQQSLGSMSRSYESKMIDKLEKWCKRHGPEGLFKESDFWAASIQG
jgi:hypothetical protein